MELLIYFLISLLAILLSCIVFSNSIEWLGAKLNLSHGITGSLLAAIGTALPETMVPLVAIFWGINKESLVKVLSGETNSFDHVNQISMGAIIGAPFMLSTIAFFLIGFSSWFYFKTGKRKSLIINVDKTVLKRDLTFFLIAFSFAFTVAFCGRFYHILLAVGLILLYLFYLYQTIKEEVNSKYKGEDLHENLDPFLLTKVIPTLKPTIFLISLQLIFSLICLIYSAHHFVEVIKGVSSHFNCSAFIISLLLTPLATELPEKFNSWMWIRQGKDTLAVGNISGALIFQSTFPVTIGLLFTNWQINSLVSCLTFAFPLLSSGLILYMVSRDKLTHKMFLWCGVFYLVYILLVVNSAF